MQYLLLIYEDETLMTERTSEQLGALMAGYREFGQGLRQAGKMLGSNALEPVSTATTVRVRDGKTLTTDGPFAETKEQLGGYYLVEADGLDEALAMAARIPAAAIGCVEVRPIKFWGEEG